MAASGKKIRASVGQREKPYKVRVFGNVNATLFRRLTMDILINNFRNFLVPISVIFGVFTSVSLHAQERPDRPVMNNPPESDDATKSEPRMKDRPTSIDAPVLTVVPAQVMTDLEK